MGVKYQGVQWNGNKVVYDLYMLVALALFMGVFMTIGMTVHPSGHQADAVVLLIRALGCAAFLMLTVVLTIGPLARMNPRFLPFLYNRRHLGVMTFLVAAAHFGLTVLWYHSSGPLNPFVSLLVSNPLYASVEGFPFEAFGLAAFAILFVMAATSHDFWLKTLSASVWKVLHMLVYVAYGLLVLHIAYGALMTEKSAVYVALVIAALAIVAGLHVVTGVREWSRDSGMKGLHAPDGWIDVCAPEDIPDKRAVTAPLPKGDRVAVFRDGAKIYAVENACRHQNGPLGEGCIKDGVITCPWHGWQYRPQDGVSPPPYEERIATHDVRLSSLGRVFVRVKKNPLGKEGAFIDVGGAAS
ncbi:MAG: ferric reductase-like transmembrane domain-containing protein [Parvularculaceae bacterium]|nr:ferric reductase-like transmembrane domain-containing protein [Parvularculaceae bacterium]